LLPEAQTRIGSTESAGEPKYGEEIIKLLPETPEPVLLERIFSKIVGIGCIHAPPADLVPA
jgi:hypothetical protein